VGFTDKQSRRFDPNARQKFALPKAPTFPMLRVALLALLGTIAAAWGLAYHYTAPQPPMLVPVPPRPAASSATYGGDAGEAPIEIDLSP